MIDTKPLTPDILGYAEGLDAEADRLGREIVKTIRFLRPDGTTATVPLTRDHGLWLDYSLRKRVDQANRSWLRKIEAILCQLETLADSRN